MAAITLKETCNLFAGLRTPALLSLLLITIAGCSSNTIKSTEQVRIKQITAEIPEDQLLDVGIHLFDPNLDQEVDDDERLIFPEVRKAEAHFIPYQLMGALQKSAAWGAVRIIPQGQNSVDVTVNGTILQSDGERMTLLINVNDASGREWFEREYTAMASKYAYTERKQANAPDPFQSIYNQIANDMLAYRERLAAEDLERIRTIAELRFAQSFSGDAFAGHLSQNRKGVYQVQRLPAADDPMLTRIRTIRERDYLFVDTLQDYYGGFVKDITPAYTEWRKNSYDEVVAYRELRTSARNRTIAGAAAIIGGILAAGSDNRMVRSTTGVAMVGGAYMIKSGFDKRAESKMHLEALAELGDSLEADVEPQNIELEDRTVTLSGTVQDQYNQWRALLQEIYRIDTGGIPATTK